MLQFFSFLPLWGVEAHTQAHSHPPVMLSKGYGDDACIHWRSGVLFSITERFISALSWRFRRCSSSVCGTGVYKVRQPYKRPIRCMKPSGHIVPPSKKNYKKLLESSSVLRLESWRSVFIYFLIFFTSLVDPPLSKKQVQVTCCSAGFRWPLMANVAGAWRVALGEERKAGLERSWAVTR